MPAQFQPSQLHTTANIRLTMRALLATHESTRRRLPDDPHMDAYNAGFQEAMLLLAEALNVNLGIPTAAHYLDR
jgi:hypothetical protein